MGASSCRSCCTDQRVESLFGPSFCNDKRIAAPHMQEAPFTDEQADAGVWDEVLHSRRLQSRELFDPATGSKPALSAVQRLEFTLRDDREELGVELQVLPGPEPALVVKGVDPEGELARTTEGGPGICPGDIVLEVDCSDGEPQELITRLQRLCSAADHIVLAIRARPKMFTVDLERVGHFWQRLGLAVALKADKGFLIIAAVLELGLATEWNAKHNQYCLCVGDRIVAVNNCPGDAVAMYSLVQATAHNGLIRLAVEPPPRYLVPHLQSWAREAVNGAVHGEHLEML